MARSILSITLAIVIHSLVFNYQLFPFGAIVRASIPKPPTPQLFQEDNLLAQDYPRQTEAATASCANPTPGHEKRCQELEQQILASTVRIEWHFWAKNENGNGYIYLDGNTGYATIKEGRYLVTHNHIGFSASELKSSNLTTVSIFKADGQPIFLDTSLEAITLVVEDPETLVLDFGGHGGDGLFESLGLSSANFITWTELPLQPGLEVAQIDWDGQAALVEWVKIDNIIAERGTPRLELNNFVSYGASGGGIFWNGLHIANNWSRITVQDKDSGEVVRRFSVAALNSEQVVAPQPEITAVSSIPANLLRSTSDEH